MPLFKVFRCMKCDHLWDGILDLCGRCGGRGAAQSGIAGALAYGRPPGYAGGVTTPHSAKSYDRAFENNFKAMGITNCEHKDGVPHCTFKRKPKGTYNTMPGWAGQQAPIRAYASLDEARAKSGLTIPPMMVNGQPFNAPSVHPVVAPGEKIGQFSPILRERTQLVARDKGGS